MTDYRDGDKVLVNATVRYSKHGQKFVVEFKNGDTYPLTSVEIERITEYAIKIGDRIDLGGGVAGTVKAVIKDIDEPQIAYVKDGEWVLRTAILTHAVRLPSQNQSPQAEDVG